MAKSSDPIVQIRFKSDFSSVSKDMNQLLNDLKGRYDNTEIDEMIEKLRGELNDFIKEANEKFAELFTGRVDASDFDNFKKSIETKMTELQEKVTSLAESFTGLGTAIKTIDPNGVTDSVATMLSEFDKLKTGIEGVDKVTKVLMQSTGLSVKVDDNFDVATEKAKGYIHTIQELEDAKSKMRIISSGKPFQDIDFKEENMSEDARKIVDVLNNIDDITDDLVEKNVDPDKIIDRTLEKYLNAQNLIINFLQKNNVNGKMISKLVTEEKDLKPNLTNILLQSDYYLEKDIVAEQIKSIEEAEENISKIIEKRVSQAKKKASSQVQSNTFTLENGEIKIPLTVVPGEAFEKAAQIIKEIQEKVSGTPIKLKLELPTTADNKEAMQDAVEKATKKRGRPKKEIVETDVSDLGQKISDAAIRLSENSQSVKLTITDNVEEAVEHIKTEVAALRDLMQTPEYEIKLKTSDQKENADNNKLQKGAIEQPATLDNANAFLANLRSEAESALIAVQEKIREVVGTLDTELLAKGSIMEWKEAFLNAITEVKTSLGEAIEKSEELILLKDSDSAPTPVSDANVNDMSISLEDHVSNLRMFFDSFNAMDATGVQEVPLLLSNIANALEDMHMALTKIDVDKLRNVVPDIQNSDDGKNGQPDATSQNIQVAGGSVQINSDGINISANAANVASETTAVTSNQTAITGIDTADVYAHTADFSSGMTADYLKAEVASGTVNFGDAIINAANIQMTNENNESGGDGDPQQNPADKINITSNEANVTANTATAVTIANSDGATVNADLVDFGKGLSTDNISANIATGTVTLGNAAVNATTIQVMSDNVQVNSAAPSGKGTADNDKKTGSPKVESKQKMIDSALERYKKVPTVEQSKFSVAYEELGDQIKRIAGEFEAGTKSAEQFKTAVDGAFDTYKIFKAQGPGTIVKDNLNTVKDARNAVKDYLDNMSGVAKIGQIRTSGDDSIKKFSVSVTDLEGDVHKLTFAWSELTNTLLVASNTIDNVFANQTKLIESAQKISDSKSNIMSKLVGEPSEIKDVGNAIDEITLNLKTLQNAAVGTSEWKNAFEALKGSLEWYEKKKNEIDSPEKREQYVVGQRREDFEKKYGGFKSNTDVLDQLKLDIDSANEKLKAGSIILQEYKKLIEDAFAAAGKSVTTVDNIFRRDISTAEQGRSEIENYLSEIGKINDQKSVMKNFGNSSEFSYQIKTANGELKDFVFTWDAATKQMTITETKSQEAMTGIGRAIDMLKGKTQSLYAYWTATFFSPMRLASYARSIINMVREYDDALTEMRKVSNESIASLREFQVESFDMGDRLGTTAKAIQDSVSDWLRLGKFCPFIL